MPYGTHFETLSDEVIVYEKAEGIFDFMPSVSLCQSGGVHRRKVSVDNMIQCNGMTLCEFCFCESSGYPCRHCGYDGQKDGPAFALVPGTILADQYYVGCVLRKSGSAVTYAAFDMTQGTRVAVKEYFPEKIAQRSTNHLTLIHDEANNLEFANGQNGFFNEANLLSTFDDGVLPTVFHFFYTNNTAYYVMEYPEGQTLAAFCELGGIQSAAEAARIAEVITETQRMLAEKNCPPVNATPDNILLCHDGAIKVIHYGFDGRISEDDKTFGLGFSLFLALTGKRPDSGVPLPKLVGEYPALCSVFEQYMGIKLQRGGKSAKAKEKKKGGGKKVAVILLSLLLLGGAAAGVGYWLHNRSSGETSVVEFDSEGMTLTEGDSYRLTRELTFSGDEEIRWTSSDEDVCTVDKNGKVTAIGAGTAVITASTEHSEDFFTVTVEAPFVPVEALNLDFAQLRLTVGEGETLECVISPANASEALQWNSSNPSVVEVSESGNVIAKGAGEATITASAGDISVSCTVTVLEPIVAVEKILMDTTLHLDVGQSYTIQTEVKPSDATEKTVTWSSDNPSAVEVDQNGKVTARGAGIATITAKVGDATASCTVTVTKAVSGLTVNRTSLGLFVGETENLTATVSPPDATDKTVTWTSDDRSVADVDKNGKVTAIGTGTAVITAKAGSVIKQCTVTVKSTIPVTGVTISPKKHALNPGETVQLSAFVSPSDATDKTVTWTSDDKNVAKVDKNGKVTAVGAGTAVITAKADGVTGQCTVTVKAVVAVSKVTIPMAPPVLKPGETVQLFAEVKPSDAADREITWISENPTVATVSQEGKVTAKRAGNAVITAKAGGKTASCTVTVENRIAVSGVSMSKTALSLSVGGSARLTASVTPADASNPRVTWSSNNPAVISVDQNGNVTALQAGQATIMATAGGKYAYCTVTAVSSGSGGTSEVTIPEVTELLDYGKCGEAVFYALDKSGTLTIYGSGAIQDGGTPWIDYLTIGVVYQYSSQIKRIVVDNGITAIGTYAFYGLQNVTAVSISGTVTEIKHNAFNNCTALSAITIPSSVTTIGTNAFNACENLETVRVSGHSSKPAGWKDKWLGDSDPMVYWGQ